MPTNPLPTLSGLEFKECFFTALNPGLCKLFRFFTIPFTRQPPHLASRYVRLIQGLATISIDTWY